MKILVTGAGGMLGKDICAVFASHNHVITTTKDTCDITKIESVQNNFDKYKPDLVINCAAYTDVDSCENNIDIAYKVNALGPKNLAICCNQIGAPLVSISTDYVFDGQNKAGYNEYDKTNPINIYGKSKEQGEQFIKQLTNQFYIIRTAWLFGINGNNFVKTMTNWAKEKKTLSIVDDQIGSPTYTLDLARAIQKLVSKPTYGTYHITNGGKCSWYQFTKDILALAQLDTRVDKIKSAQLKRLAKRPDVSVLNNQMWQLEGYEPLRNYKLALKDYITQLEVEK